MFGFCRIDEVTLVVGVLLFVGIALFAAVAVKAETAAGILLVCFKPLTDNCCCFICACSSLHEC